ncbi:hypothetical protein EON64_00440, partial [archaeon]
MRLHVMSVWSKLLVAALCALLTLGQEDNSMHPCPNACSKHGRCHSPSRQCECFDGYTGADCSLRICPFDRAWADKGIQDDNAHRPAECSNKGLCDRTTGLCVCQEGFEGIACERQSCPNNCNGVGECQSMSFYALTKDPGSGSVYAYNNVWDASSNYVPASGNKIRYKLNLYMLWEIATMPQGQY